MQGAPKLRFAIFWAGALIRDRNLSYIYKENMSLPSVHIIGDKDYVKEVLFPVTKHMLAGHVLLHKRVFTQRPLFFPFGTVWWWVKHCTKVQPITLIVQLHGTHCCREGPMICAALPCTCCAVCAMTATRAPDTTSVGSTTQNP